MGSSAGFVFNTLMSMQHDVSHGSPGMDRVTDFIKSDRLLALNWAEYPADLPEEPLIRCENCTNTLEEIDRNTIPERTSAGTTRITNLGFGTPNPSGTQSPSLQRQISLLEAERPVDYFLFCDDDGPMRVIIEDRWTKVYFRLVRSEAMFGPEQYSAAMIAEYLIKMMGDQPGLSRERILAQFVREYGEDVAAHVAALEANDTGGMTLLEMMSGGMEWTVSRRI